MKKIVLLLGLALGIQFGNGSYAAELTLKVVDKEPPKEIAPDIAKTLEPKAVQVLDGDKPVFEYWFCKEIALKSKPESPAKALDSLEQAALLGAVSVSKTTRDYRDDELSAGVYTVRFALQPQDANHSGSSDFVYFAVLVPAKSDPKPGSFTEYKPLVKASAEEASTEHPHVISLRPASSDEGSFPEIHEPAPEHKSIRLKLPAKAGDLKISLAFELVCEGHIKH